MTFNKFIKNRDYTAYKAASRNTWINSIYSELNIIKRKKHTIDSVINIAENYTGSKFSIDHPHEYDFARNNGILDKLNGILGIKKKLKLTKIKVLDFAKTKTSENFKAMHTPYYKHAIKHGYLQELKKTFL